MNSWFRLAPVLLGAVCLVGCAESGPATVPVTGKVTIGGKPADGMQITFSPVVSGQEPASGNIGSDGTYSLFTGVDGKAGAMPGKYKIVLSDPNDQSYMQPGADPTKRSGRVPEGYANATTSPKEVEVSKDNNTINIEL